MTRPLSRRLSRRHFIKAAGLGAAALASLRAGQALAQEPGPDGTTYNFFDPTISFNEVYGNPPMFGRVHGAARIRIFEAPDPKANSSRVVFWGFTMPIMQSVRGPRYDSRAASPVWFQTHEGFVHSGYVVPCREQYHEPVASMDEPFWGEVSVPISWQFKRPSLRGGRWDYAHYQNFWGQVHQVLERAEDEEGHVWYRLHDEIEPERPAWVLAHHIRKIERAEFEPISLGVQDKRIEISLAQQMLTAYEGSTVVFKTRIASGTSFQNDDGELVDFQTVEGDYIVERKRPSRRMRGGSDVGLPYDVNGVPWVTYFGDTGAAIHGAYWHNNYGTPRSHGCINVTPDAAKWIYRWSAPHLSYEDEYRWREAGEHGTAITVV